VREDQRGVDAVAREAVQRAVVAVAGEVPEALVGQSCGAWAELVAEQPVQAEDLVGVGGLVGDDHRRAAGAGRLEFEQAVEGDQRVAQGAGDDDRVQAGELVAHVVQPCHAAAGVEVARVGAGVDRADGDAEAHPVDRRDMSVAERCDERDLRVHLEQEVVGGGDRLGAHVVLADPRKARYVNAGTPGCATSCKLMLQASASRTAQMLMCRSSTRARPSLRCVNASA